MSVMKRFGTYLSLFCGFKVLFVEEMDPQLTLSDTGMLMAVPFISFFKIYIF